VPLRFHENCIYDFKNRKGLVAAKTAAYVSLLWGLVHWDVLMTYFKKTGSTSTVTIPTLFVAMAISRVNNTIERKKTTKSVDVTDNFTKLFNNLSLRKKRKVMTYQSVFPWNHVSGFYKELAGSVSGKAKR